MNKRKWFWIILGIIVLIIFMSVAPKRKDLSFSPLRIKSPGYSTYPWSPSQIIDDDAEFELRRMRYKESIPTALPLPGTITTCSPNNEGYVYDCSIGPHQETEGSVCICENGQCSTVIRTCKDNNDGNLVCKTGPKGTGICLSVLIS